MGLPYESNGRDRDGVDCWGLVRLVYLEVCGVELPSLEDTYRLSGVPEPSMVQALEDESERAWLEVADPRPLDVYHFRILGHPCHVGLHVRPGWMLHALRGEACLQRLRPSYAHRIATIFRHRTIRL